MGEPLDVNRFLADLAYTAVGFGVLGFQRAQVRRRELTKQLDHLLRQAGEQAAGLGRYGAAGSAASGGRDSQ